MSAPINPDTVRGSGRRELPAYVSNGLIGLRVRELPLTSGMTLVSGYSGQHYERQIEAAAVAPYPIAGDIALDGVWLSDVPQQVENLEQDYDFSNGELTTRFDFRTGEHLAKVEVVTFCNRHDPSLVCQEVSLTVDAACGLGLRAIVDASGADGRALRHSRVTPGEAEPATDGTLLWESAGALSTCGVALVTEVLGGGDVAPSLPPLRDHRLVSEYAVRARAGRTIRLRQIASVIPSAMHAMPDQQAGRLAAKARFDGFDAIRKQNRAAWTELWKGRIRVEGASACWQGLIDAAFFYLNSSVHPSAPASTSIFGLATWHDYHYYFGHVMWDIEAFAVPPLSVLQPKAAEALLAYRSDKLLAARAQRPILVAAACNFPGKARRAAERKPRPAGHGCLARRPCLARRRPGLFALCRYNR